MLHVCIQWGMDRRDRLKLSGETGIDPRTVGKWGDDPSSVASGLDYALRAAAKKLGIDRPQPQQPASEAG